MARYVCCASLAAVLRAGLPEPAAGDDGRDGLVALQDRLLRLLVGRAYCGMVADLGVGGACSVSLCADGQQSPKGRSRSCSRGLLTGRGGLSSWRKKRPGCSITTTSAPSTSCL